MTDRTPEDPAPGASAEPADAAPAPAVAPGIPAAEARIAEELTDGGWHRLHPATPVLRGGLVFIVAIGFLLSSLREQIVERFVPGQDRGGEGDLIPMLVETGALIWVLLALLAFTLLAVGVSYLSWRMHTFRVTEETVEVRSGILSRTNRRARLDRIQGVNIVRPLVARLIGAAKLEIQVAGNDANLPLHYLRSRDADAFRLRVLRLASGARAEAAGSAPAAPGVPARGFVGSRVDDLLAPELDPDAAPPQSVVRIPIPRLVGAVLLSAPTVVLVLFVVVGIPLIVRFEAWYLLVPLLPTLLGSAGFFVRRITRSLRYSVAGTPDGVRVGFGLLSTSNDTIPPGRIHAVEVVQPLLWRAAGWWEIRITRASHSSSPGAAGQQNTSILPVGDRRDVDRVLGLVLPDLVGEQALALVAVGMTGRGGVDDGFTTSPRRAWILKPFSWRRTGFAVDASAFLVRRGMIWRRLVIVPHARTQGVDLTQGPIDRRLDLVSVRAATVAGPVDTRLGAIDRATGMELSTRLVAAAVASARSDTSARWGAEAASWPAPGSAAASAPAEPSEAASSAPAEPSDAMPSAPAEPSEAAPSAPAAVPAPSESGPAPTPASEVPADPAAWPPSPPAPPAPRHRSTPEDPA
ncbi:PH domain-containing protein [Clavibacter michiganensis subsp. phaseoli]|uniref:PH domain-containing protein n=1 Tax=Clavibacter phaseoli TaxID=1734031 RepID=UPI001FB33A4B|nr:PH domain-containing protein [Clavibacter phaseoli]MCJ1710280.1 PH domain-containing protein [Clavibacter phaseoli]